MIRLPRIPLLAAALALAGCRAARPASPATPGSPAPEAAAAPHPTRAVLVGSQLVLEFPGTVEVVADLSPEARAAWPAFALDSAGPELRFRATAVFACGLPEASATVRGDLLRARVRPAPGTEQPDCASGREALPVRVRIAVPAGAYRVEVARKGASAFDVDSGRVRVGPVR